MTKALGRILTNKKGTEFVFSLGETLKLITDRCIDDLPFYFIRFSDVDSHIIRGQIPALKKQRLLEEKHKAQNIQVRYEAKDENLRKEMEEVYDLKKLNSDRIIITRHNGKLLYHNQDYPLNKGWLYYCFSDGFCFPELFIPFLKQSFSNSLFLCDSYSANNEYIKKMFSVKTFIELPPSAYFHIEDIYPKVKKLAKSHREIVGAVGFSTKVIAKRLINDGINVKFIDLGAAVDLMAGNVSRALHRKILKNQLRMQWENIYTSYADAFGFDRNGFRNIEYIDLSKRKETT